MVTVPLTLALLFPQIWIIDCREKTEAELLSSAEWGRIRLKPEAVGEGGKADRRSLNRAGGGPEEGGDGGSGNGTDETGGGGNVTGTEEAGGDGGSHNSTQENPEEAGGGGGGLNGTDGNPQEAKGGGSLNGTDGAPGERGEGGNVNGTDVSSQGGGEGGSSKGTDGKPQGEGVGSVNGTDREPDEARDGGTTIENFDDAQAWAKENLWNETVELPIDAGENGNLTVDLPIDGTNTTVDIIDLPIDGTNITDVFANETSEEPPVHDNVDKSLNGTDANSEGTGEGDIPEPTSQDPNEANSPPAESSPQELPPDENAPQDESAPQELPPDGKTEAELLSSAEWGSIEHIDVAGEPIKIF